MKMEFKLKRNRISYPGLVLAAACYLAGSASISFASPVAYQPPSVDLPMSSMSASGYLFGEPLPEARLSQLETMYLAAQDKDDKLQLGAILYRYGNEAATTYLTQMLEKEADPMAAAIFALSRDENRVKAIVRSFERDKSQSPMLIEAMGQFDNDSIKAALLRRFRHNRRNADLALALARLNVKEAAGEIGKTYKELEIGDIDEMKFAVVLAKLAPAKTKFFTWLMSRMKGSLLRKKPLPDGISPDFVAIFIMKNFSYVQDERVVPWLKSLVETIYPDDVTRGIEKEDKLAGNALFTPAVQALSSFQRADIRDTLTNLFVSLTEEEKGQPKSWSFEGGIARAAFDSDPAAEHAALKEKMGAAWLDKRRKENALRAIPQDLLSLNEKLGRALFDGVL